MYRRQGRQWLKHVDFILLDILVLQISYVLAYFFRHGTWNPYSKELYAIMAASLSLCDLLVIFLMDSYRGILKRGYWVEFVRTLEQAIEFMVLGLVYLFATQAGEQFSRITYFSTGGINVFISYFTRILWKYKNQSPGTR